MNTKKDSLKKILLCMLLMISLALSTILPVQAVNESEFQEINIASGYNADVIATSSLSNDVESYHNTDAIDGLGKAERKACFYSKTAANEEGYLPDNGIVSSSTIEGLTWQLAPYTSNNAMRLAGTQNGVFTFSGSNVYDTIYFLCVAGGIGSGSSAEMITTIKYTDGTVEQSAFKVYDWYDNESAATSEFRRLNAGVVDGSIDSGPYMTQCGMTVNSTKTVSEVSITNQTNNGTLINVFAATGHTHGLTMGHDSINHWKSCVCGTIVDKVEHTYGDWVITKDATTKVEGTKERVCSVCQAVESATIDIIVVPGVNQTTNNVVKTNDTNIIVMYMLLIMVSGVGVYTLKKKKI